MRQRRAAVIYSLYLIVVAGFSFFVYISILNGNAPIPDPDVRRTLGKSIFMTVSLLQLTAITFIAPALTAGSLSGEREHKTFDLLRITLVSAREIVNGKFLSSISLTFLLIVSSLPLQAFALLLGGVSIIEFTISILILIVTTIFFSATGIYFSSLFPRSLPAVVLAYLLTNFILIGLPILIFSLLPLFPAFTDMLFIGLFQPNLLSPNLIPQILILIIVWFIASSNPIFAAMISEFLFVQNEVIFWQIISLSKTFNFPFFSPWLGFVILYSLTAWIFYRQTIKKVALKDQS